MFTGIILDKGTVLDVVPSKDGIDRGCEFTIQSIVITSDLKLGDSVCCNGTCLSAFDIGQGCFKVYAVAETLSKTNLGQVKKGDVLNLEPALLPTSRMGGHYVSGHVDGLAKVKEFRLLSDGSAELELDLPSALARYCIAKGSIAINGISLTLADIQSNTAKVALIPLTLEHTNIGKSKKGAYLNIEVDMMGKYIEKLIQPYTGKSQNSSDGSDKGIFDTRNMIDGVA